MEYAYIQRGGVRAETWISYLPATSVVELAAAADTLNGLKNAPSTATESVAASDTIGGTGTSFVAEAVVAVDSAVPLTGSAVAGVEGVVAGDASNASVWNGSAGIVFEYRSPGSTQVFAWTGDGLPDLGTYTGVVGESVVAGDLMNASAALAAARAESVAAVDAALLAMNAPAAMSEVIAAADSLSGAFVMVALRSETAGALDVEVASMTPTLALSDSIATADSASMVPALVGVQADTAVSADTSGIQAAMAVAITEGTPISDILSALFGIPNAVVIESAIAVSNEDGLRQGSYFVNVADTVYPVDLVSTGTSLQALIVELGAALSQENGVATAPGNMYPVDPAYVGTLLESLYTAVRQNFLAKKPVAAQVTLSFDYTTGFQFGEYLTGMVARSIIVIAGTDPNPEAMFVGAPEMSGDGTLVQQSVTGGVAGNYYGISMLFATNQNRKLELSVILPVS